MREKLNTLPLSELKEMAKAQGLRGISGLRKAELIDALCRLDEESRGAASGGQESSGAVNEAGSSRQADAETGTVKTSAPAEGASPSGETSGGFRSRNTGDSGRQAGSGENRSRIVMRRRDDNLSSRENGRENGRENHRQDRNYGDNRSGRPNNRYENRNNYTNRNNFGNRNRNQDGNGQDNNGRNSFNGMNGTGAMNGAGATNGAGTVNGASAMNGAGTASGVSAMNGAGTINGAGMMNGSGNMNGNAGNNGASGVNGNSGMNGNAGTNSVGGMNGTGTMNGADGANSFGTMYGAGGMSSSGGGTGMNGANSGQTSRQSYGIREGARPDGRNAEMTPDEIQELDSGLEANGILEVMPDGFGFIRCENFLPGDNDVYVAPSQIRRFNMKTGDIVRGNRRVKAATEKFAALLYVTSINGYPVGVAERRPNFEDLTPIFPNQRLHMEMGRGANSVAMRILDLMAPIGKGQRGMIVSPPKAGKTTLLKQVAKAITTNHPDMHLIILLIDERPEEVTDIKEAIVGDNVEVIYSTFDELPERHKRVSEMVIERARRLVEHGRDVTILLDSITRLARAYNLVVPPSGRTLSGGLDPAALHMPKRFFGAARNTREGGSLTILATALIDTGSRMDDVIYEEFKGTGNMELVLDRKLSERRVFPAIDVLKSGTRRDDLLLSREEAEAMEIIRRATNSMKPEDSVEKLVELFARTRSNQELVSEIRRRRYL